MVVLSLCSLQGLFLGQKKGNVQGKDIFLFDKKMIAGALLTVAYPVISVVDFISSGQLLH